MTFFVCRCPMSIVLKACALFSLWVYHQDETNYPVQFNKLIVNERVVLSELDSVCFLAFRGSHSLEDFMNDLKSQTFQECSENGFLKGFEESFSEITIHEQIKDKISSSCGGGVFFTGHSLGGSLSTIASKKYEVDIKNGAITFGTPRTCCNDHHVDNGMRFVNKHDIIPALPEPFEVKKVHHCERVSVEIPSKEYYFDYYWPTVTENHNIFDHDMGKYYLDMPEYINKMLDED